MKEYPQKSFNLSALLDLPEGEQLFSQTAIDEHLKLYAGYVKNLNGLYTTLADLMQDSEKNAFAFGEVKRRLGFEFNGVRLHELYFEQLEPVGAASEIGLLRESIEAQWGSYEAFEAEFKAAGKMRGIGWALLVHDEVEDALHTVWVADHELGHLGGQTILLAMDVWEHAYWDYKPTGRGAYIDAFMKHVNWGVVEKRFRK